MRLELVRRSIVGRLPVHHVVHLARIAAQVVQLPLIQRPGIDQLVRGGANAVLRADVALAAATGAVVHGGTPFLGWTAAQDRQRAAPLHVGRHLEPGRIEEPRRERACGQRRRDGRSERARGTARIAGRVLCDVWPTGVAVVWSLRHSGPWPSTTHPLRTSVGITAMRRRLVPIAFQGWPEDLLPDELKAANPLGLPRHGNGVLGARQRDG